MPELFTTGTSRGGTGIHTNILNTNKCVKLAQDPYLALWKSFRDDVVLKSNIKNFVPNSPLGEYYFISDQLAIMDMINQSNLNIKFDQPNNLEKLRENLASRIYLSSGTLKDKLHLLKGKTYKCLVDSSLEIVNQGLRGDRPKWLGFNENWCAEFFDPLLTSYPKSKFIIYIRDVRAAIASHLKLFEKNPDFNSAIALVLSFARSWRKHVAYAIKYSSLKEFKGRIICVRYEDLIIKPKLQVQNLCRFLDVEFSEEMLNTDIFTSTDGGKWYPNSNHLDTPQSGIFNDSLYKWEQTLSKSIVELIEFVCGPELKLFGYDLKCNLDEQFPEKAFNFHKYDHENCVGWRTDNKDPLRDFGYECLRRALINSNMHENELIRSCFLFPEVYSQIKEKRLSINSFFNFELI